MSLRPAAQEWTVLGDTVEEKFADAQLDGLDGMALGTRRGGVALPWGAGHTTPFGRGFNRRVRAAAETTPCR